MTTTLQRTALALIAGAALVAGLPGCVPLVVVGGAAAAGVGLMAVDRRSSGAQLDDQGIELRAAARIRDIANDRMNITVVSYNRQALLLGTVGTEADRQRAEQAVRGVENVRSVVDEVTVGPGSTLPGRSNDTYLTTKVKASMLDAKDVSANVFKVVTEDSVVYLMGIATRRETDRVTDIARGVSGVRKVVRLVEIVTDAQLASPNMPAGATAGGTGAAPASGSHVPLPPMAPLPATPAPATTVPAPATNGVVTMPVR